MPSQNDFVKNLKPVKSINAHEGAAFNAEWDFMHEGCNCNKYPKNTTEWFVYEQTFDRCEIDQERNQH